MPIRTNFSRVTKAYDVLEVQDVLRMMHHSAVSVRRVHINIIGHVMVNFRSPPVRYAGRVSEEVRQWLEGRIATVYEWNVTGGETFPHEGGQPRLFGLNLAIAIQSDADSQAQAPDRQASER